MHTSNFPWTIDHIFSIRSTIREQPKYQRGEVWNPRKRQMLIDSILRGFDVPKIYLRQVNNGMFTYEVADGQQRLKAIFDFKDNVYPLSSITFNGLDLSKIGRYTVGDKYYRDLNSALQERFDNFELTIAKVEEATNAEIRTLFGRLQMGDPLVPAEIRNAIISQIGLEIDNIALNHNFFKDTKIKSARYKHQDYLTHILALLHYNNTKGLKAPLLQELYFDLATVVPNNYASYVVQNLEHMYEIDKFTRKRIVNKWAFLDFFWFLHTKRGDFSSINYQGIGEKFDEFEIERARYSRRPEELIQKENPSDYEVKLYDYIVAFKLDGGSPRNIERRFNTFNFLFNDYLSI